MIPKEKQAAQMLIGVELKGGWIVKKKLERENYQSGGVYSCCYEVENGLRKGFLKAFDYSAANKVSEDFVDQMKNILTAFSLEKEILEKCMTYRCKNVIQILENGSLEVKDAEKYPRVEYLILEYAEKGDVRNAISENNVSLEWKIRSLHQLAKGLNELHKISIAHQDVKPSNIVTLKSGLTKITDFGSAITLSSEKNELPKHLNNDYAGSWEYAPPELLYGDINTDPIIRRIGCDLYLLGSMVAFYFTNISMTALIKMNLEDGLCWTKNSNYGNYNAIKSYVILAFERALEDIGRQIENVYLREKVLLIIKFLCNPDPLKRGHIKNITELGSNYSLERFVTMFDLLATRIKLKKL
jgi:serine/threonine protein kinase